MSLSSCLVVLDFIIAISETENFVSLSFVLARMSLPLPSSITVLLFLSKTGLEKLGTCRLIAYEKWLAVFDRFKTETSVASDCSLMTSLIFIFGLTWFTLKFPKGRALLETILRYKSFSLKPVWSLCCAIKLGCCFWLRSLFTDGLELTSSFPAWMFTRLGVF